MSEDEGTVLVCGTVEVPGPVLPGSVRGSFCSKCGTEIWIALAGQALLAERNEQGLETTLLCQVCGWLEIVANQDAEVTTAPGAIEEIRAYLRQPPV